MFFLVLFICLCIIWLLYSSIKRPEGYPPGPSWIPIITNTYYLRALARQLGGQHLAFEDISRQYSSPIIGLKLGRDLVVVAMTYTIIKEVHSREEFDGRPDNFFLRLRTMGTRLGITCTDGGLWWEHRNFVVRNLRNVGYGRERMEKEIQDQLDELLDVIRGKKDSPVWPGTFLPPSVINILWAFTTGTRISRNDHRLQRLLDLLQQRSKAFDMSGGVLSQMPWMRFIAPEKTGYNLLKRFNNDLYELFMETIEKHRNTYTEEKANDDLIYAYIKEMNERKNDKNSSFTVLQLSMIILDIFIAGSQTTSSTIDLALMVLVLRKDIQQKVYEEIVKVVGKEQPSVIYRQKMPYTSAFLLEVQRFFHIVPVSGPRRALKNTTLGGYRIPKNTTILIGLKTVHMDEEYWVDPKVFRPERFLDENMCLKTLDHFMPFGQGRRRCLGDMLARACMFTFLVGILQHFEIHTTKGEHQPSMKLLPGITLSPKPYNVSFKAR